MIQIKILGNKNPQRYAMRRAVRAAQEALLLENPEVEFEVIEVREPQEIQKYTAVSIYPSLVIDEKLVCIGRYPSKNEIREWLQMRIQ